MKKSNIKTFIYAHTDIAVSSYLNVSIKTLYNWIKQGHANPRKIDKLAKYPCSIMTKEEFLADIKEANK